jgi:two-component system chemotaxis response regulator CheB
MTRKIRVLIVEDSMVNQKLLMGILGEESRFEIAGVVTNGRQAVEFVSKDRPDIISMDLFMPVMDGLEATALIMQNTPVPIVIVSSYYHPNEVQLSFKILEAGALTIISRPLGPGHPNYESAARNYRNTLKNLSEIKVLPIRSRVIPKEKKFPHNHDYVPKQLQSAENSQNINKPVDYQKQVDIIAIGASAGGPQAISRLLKEIPKSLKVPVMIVQHIDKNFASGYSEWLANQSNIPVHTASHGDKMLPGHAYLPPGDRHLGLISKGIISVSANPAERGLRPAVSFLFRNVLYTYGKNSVGIILSGMGSDGAAELKLLYDSGALTMAQDEASSLVYGMPGEAIRQKGVSVVLSPEEMVEEIMKIANLQ